MRAKAANSRSQAVHAAACADGQRTRSWGSDGARVYLPGYELRTDLSSTTQSRALAQLRAGDIDVWASMCSRSRQDAGISLPICLRRGVNGVRLPDIALWEPATKTHQVVRRFGYQDYKSRLG